MLGGLRLSQTLQKPPIVGKEPLCSGTLHCSLKVLLLLEVQGLQAMFSEDMKACLCGSGKG